MCETKSLSIHLYETLDYIGVSEDLRQKYRENAFSREITLTAWFQQTHRKHNLEYIVGSASEGTTTRAMHSDVDFLQVRAQFPVIEDLHDAPLDGMSFIMRTEGCFPGYVLLQTVKNGVPSTVENSVAGKSERIDQFDRICIRPMSTLGKFDFIQTRNGPADSNCGRPGNYPADYVSAFQSRKIPRCVAGWLDRKRKYKWPSSEQLQRFKTYGCFFVGVGHKLSFNKDKEWRISFSLQERELMFGLTPTQHKCYVVLKMINKNILGIIPNHADYIHTYHMKTSLLYTVESTSLEFWSRGNLLVCIQQCVEKFLRYVEEGFCPNFFIPEQNLFEQRFDHEFRVRIVKRLKYILNSNHRYLWQLHTDNIGRLLDVKLIACKNKCRLDNGFGKATYKDRIRTEFSLFRNLMYDIMDIRKHILLTICKDSNDIQTQIRTLVNCMHNFRNLKTVTNHSEEDTKNSLSTLLTVLSEVLAQFLGSLVVSYKERESEHAALQPLHEWFWWSLQEGSYYGTVSTSLILASVLYKKELYELCSDVLQSVDNSLKCYTVSICGCNSMLARFKNSALHNMRWGCTSKHQFLRQYATICMNFLPSQANLLPPALQLEMLRSRNTENRSRDELRDFWFDWVAVDSKVYLYFMQYLVFSKLKKQRPKLAAIDNLRWTIKHEPDLGHRETACNLLGWVLVEEKEIRDGMAWFLKSLQIRPLHNAAKFHMEMALGKRQL